MNILSIQSGVAYGHVGNAAAVFPLQRLGHEVWPVDTVQFSNHTGYGGFRGRVFGAEHVREVVDGIAERGVLGECDAVLSGYLGDAGTGLAVLDAVAAVHRANSGALYCCDPVLGDAATGLYVRPELPAFMASRAMPAADVVTPNRFELELLSGIAVGDRAAALRAARRLLAAGPRIVVATSLDGADTPAGSIDSLAVTADGAWLVRTPRLALAWPPSGAGDAFAALFLGHYLGAGNVAGALSLAVSGLFAVLQATQAAKRRELALVSAQDSLMRPPRLFPATTAG